MIGKHHYEVFPEIPERWREIHRRVLGGSVERAAADPFRRQDGHVDWVSWECRPWRRADGDIGGMILYSELITERREAEEELRQSRGQYETFINATDDIAFLKDDQLRYIIVNTANAAFFGRSVEEIVGRTDAELMPAAAAEDCHASDLRALESGGLVVTTEQQGDRIYESRKFPVALTDGRTGIGGYVRDVTEQRRAEGEIMRLASDLERRVTQRTAQLEATNRELESFAYSISHDLRSPLRALDGFSEILLQDYGEALDDAGRDYLRRIKGAANHMAGLMDGLLQLSRLNREELDFKDVDLTALAASFVAELRERDPARDVVVDIAPGLVARADPKLIARRAREPARQRLEVHVAARDGAHRVRGGPVRRRRDVLRARRRRRLRHALRQEPLRRLPAPAHPGPVRGHRDRARDRPAHRAPPRRHGVGGGRGREGRDLLVHAGAAGRTPERRFSASGDASSSATRSSRDCGARMRSIFAPSVTAYAAAVGRALYGVMSSSV